MSEPFYIKCACGGELELYPVIGRCMKCNKSMGGIEMVNLHAAALGVAVEALEKISGTNPANSSAWPVMVIRDIQDTAEDALRSIRGEEKSL